MPLKDRLMYDEIFQRNKLYWGDDFQLYLKNKYVAIIGLGGVGGYALEALCRLGINKILIADFDTVSISNINRQLIALNSNINMKKTDAFKKRLYDINPDIELIVYDGFIDEENFKEIFTVKPDFIIDAIDTIKPKISLIKYAKENNINIISSFGAGNRMDASKLYVCDISEIQYKDNFTKNLLSKLKKYANIDKGIWAVASLEHAKNLQKIKNVEKIQKNNGEIIEFTKFTPASNAIVPAVSGLLAVNCVLQVFYGEFNSKAQ